MLEGEGVNDVVCDKYLNLKCLCLPIKKGRKLMIMKKSNFDKLMLMRVKKMKTNLSKKEI